MEKYEPQKIESKWQKSWEENKIFKTPKNVTPDNKYYILDMFPYPSGSGLHVGHVEGYTATDILARWQKMNGKEVLHPMGWDAFGLPAENYAIKTGVHPDENTKKAVATFKEQMNSVGFTYDWDREINTSDPNYYKWTQWFFLLFYKRGLVYRKKQAVNWCESCKTVLANDQVKEGNCERCDNTVEQKDMEQWYIKITEYADKLLEGLEKIDWPEETKKRQRDWIGRSEGASVRFAVIASKAKQSQTKQEIASSSAKTPRNDGFIEVFTTRPDTLFGATYMVLAPEGQYVQDLKDSITNWDEVEKYIKVTSKKTELDRQMNKEKTGVELKGIKAINPVNNEEIPIYIADYVLATYGTGAIMAVPAHDERDWEFAKKFGIEIKEVVARQVGKRKKEGYKRPGVYAIVFDDKKEKVLVQYDKNIDYYRLPGGGIDGDETEAEALKREFQEETGFVNFDIRDYLLTVEGNHYTSDRIDYQHRLLQIYEIKLQDEQKDVSMIDKDIYEYSWMNLDEAEKAFAKNKQEIGEIEVIQYAFGKLDKCFSGDGVNINSGFLTDLETSEAKTKIIEWLEENNFGKRKIQYKLRDWSVSRQRFWGAPIPMLSKHISDKQSKQNKFVLVYGFTGSPKDNFFPWLQTELEKVDNEVVCPELPNTNEPNVEEQAKAILDSTEITEDTVFVAHSLGGAVVMKILEKINLKVARVIFVDAFTKPEFNDNSRDEVEKSCDWKFDFEKIKNNVQDFVVMGEKDFSIIPKEEIELMTKLFNARLIITEPQEDHYCGKEESAILEECLMSNLRPVPESDLPVLLPEDVDFKPTGESPLNYSKEFKNRAKEKYGDEWHYEPDTLDTFMCSSWYYFRYLDPKNDSAFASPEALKKWMPVDFYLGGPEHVNGHLLYSRFFTKVLFDAGFIDFDEPFSTLRHQGLILGPDNRKMSKRWGNVVNPTDVVNQYGADTCRMYEMFMGPLEDDKPWDENGVKGVRRFLDKVWNLQSKVESRKSKIILIN